MNLKFIILLLSQGNVFAAVNVKFLLKFFKRQVEDIKNVIGADTECYKQMQIFQNELENLKTWPLAMLDASGKLESGLMQGTMVMFGNYDECLNLNQCVNGSNVQGKFCTTAVQPTEVTRQCVLGDPKVKSINQDMLELINTVQLKWGVCVLNGCTTSELQRLWDFIEDRYQVKLHVTFKDNTCFTRDDVHEYSLLFLLSLVIFLALVIVIFVSTMYDIFVFQNHKEKNYNLWMAFSFYTNSKRLLSTKHTDASNISCMYGLRVITMAWIVLGHTYLAHIQLLASNNIYLLEWLKEDWTMFIMGALSGVDTFLMISGFLIVYVTGIARARGTPVHLFVFYGHRLLRLTPAFAAMILVYVGIATHLGNGPLWNELDRILAQPCLEHWWRSILYIQNYYVPDTQCFTHGWYLSVDTQLYVLSPILIILLQKMPKTGVFTVVVLICVCIVGNVKTTLDYNIESLTIRNLFIFFFQIYIPTHLRAASWLVGILFGHILVNYNEREIHMNRIYVVICWILTLTTMLIICYCYVIATKYGITLVSISIFNGFSHTLWAICIGWVIFACSKGYGGMVNKFLSLPLFRVLSRITYGIYLTHILVIWYLLFRRRTHSYAENLTQFHEFWGNYMFSIAISYIWTLIFESPVAILESVAKEKADVWIQKLSPWLLFK